MMGARYPTKTALKESVGQALKYEETSMFGPEYESTGSFNVVGPSPYKRVWYATVVMKDDKIVKVS
jgi:hypothetical protein